mmetsp:Transcript_7128/g.24768  ORF Transcript_7128/g.24768 Transcript_7128/m.24768 type:complete len:95 (+) Transcript_7128:158-442(+)
MQETGLWFPDSSPADEDMLKDKKTSSNKIDFRAWAQGLRDSSDYDAPDTTVLFQSDMIEERALWENEYLSRARSTQYSKGGEVTPEMARYLEVW